MNTGERVLFKVPGRQCVRRKESNIHVSKAGNQREVPDNALEYLVGCASRGQISI